MAFDVGWGRRCWEMDSGAGEVGGGAGMERWVAQLQSSRKAAVARTGGGAWMGGGRRQRAWGNGEGERVCGRAPRREVGTVAEAG